MHPLEKKIALFVEREALLPADVPVVLAVSGGVDSMAMLFVLAALRQRLSLGRLLAVYVDHGLRPLEVAAERAAVARACQGLDISFICCQVDVAAEQEKGKSLEEAARDVRYQALAEVADRQGAKAIAVAHTADDQAEELLLRLLRGTGRAGLSGMRSARFGRVVRPLLQVGKDELRYYLVARKLRWCEDSSNNDRAFLRNQVRLDILPFLERYNPNLRQGLRRMARVLQDEEDFLEKEWHLLKDQLITERSGVLEVDIADLVRQHPAMRRRCIEAVFLRMESHPSVERVESVLRLAQWGPGKGQLHFRQGLRLLKKDGKLRFSYPQGRVAKRGDLQSGAGEDVC